MRDTLMLDFIARLPGRFYDKHICKPHLSNTQPKLAKELKKICY